MYIFKILTRVKENIRESYCKDRGTIQIVHTENEEKFDQENIPSMNACHSPA